MLLCCRSCVRKIVRHAVKTAVLSTSTRATTICSETREKLTEGATWEPDRSQHETLWKAGNVHPSRNSCWLRVSPCLFQICLPVHPHTRRMSKSWHQVERHQNFAGNEPSRDAHLASSRSKTQRRRVDVCCCETIGQVTN